MEYALYRFEFEVIENMASSMFFTDGEFPTPRQAFERKGELLNELLEKDYKMQVAEQDIFSKEYSEEKSPLLFINGNKKPLKHQYVTAPKEGFAIIELARLSSVSHRPHPFQTTAIKEDDYKSLHIILDNRNTHQRVAIEVKPSAFSTDAVAASLSRALNEAFARYGLEVKVVPLRDDKHFWNIVTNKKQFPHGFKRLRVEFPQINDPELSERLKRAQIEYREMFDSNLILIQEAPEGESLNFDKEDERQQEYVKISTENADSIKLSPIGGRTFALGGKAAKTQMMTDSERKSIEDGCQPKELLDDPTQSTKTFMDKAYGQS